MPDIAGQARPTTTGVLDWVGMDEIAIPLRLAGPADDQTVAAKVHAAVNLNRPEARGIHMSRLYLHLDRLLTAEPLSPHSLRRLLGDFLDSHADLSDRAMVVARFPLLVRRGALRSTHSGWRSYPVSVRGVLDRDGFTAEMTVEVMYSSTCPASAALARQEIQDAFRRDFPLGTPLDHDAVHAWLGDAQGIWATPHAQRSVARACVKLLPAAAEFPAVELIDRMERTLATPVQTAVKREDEQAFAVLNGANLMFCEDAARRLQAMLDADPDISDFHVRVAHLESLHAHDAVAEAGRGVTGRG